MAERAGGVYEGFWSWKRDWGGLKEVEGERKGGSLAILELGENLRELLERKQRKEERKNVSESKG